MEVHINESKGTMTARLVGRLDTPAAAEVTREIQPLLDHAGETLVLDCSEMTYISSSGLRIFLTLRKAAAAAGMDFVGVLTGITGSDVLERYPHRAIIDDLESIPDVLM
jgi:anti-sigma B factor antagonist